MKHDEILKQLCMYDERNPDNFCDLQESPPTQCKCDNCFYGRTKLAECLLDAHSLIEESIEVLSVYWFTECGEYNNSDIINMQEQLEEFINDKT